MYTTSYKLNNSYTTYVIHDYGEDTSESHIYRRAVKRPEWRCGARVNHTFHGKGEIVSIADHRVTVLFKASRICGGFKRIQVSFEFKVKPSEIGGLYLC